MNAKLLACALRLAAFLARRAFGEGPVSECLANGKRWSAFVVAFEIWNAERAWDER